MPYNLKVFFRPIWLSNLIKQPFLAYGQSKKLVKVILVNGVTKAIKLQELAFSNLQSCKDEIFSSWNFFLTKLSNWQIAKGTSLKEARLPIGYGRWWMVYDGLGWCWIYMVLDGIGCCYSQTKGEKKSNNISSYH